MTSVRKTAKRVAAWDRYTRRYLVRDEDGLLVTWSRTTLTDIRWYDRWIKARRSAAARRRVVTEIPPDSQT